MRAALLACVLLAGCAAPAALPEPAATDADALPASLLHDASGVVGAAPPIAARLVEVAGMGNEPTVGATSDGTLFLAGVLRALPGGHQNRLDDRLMRSRDMGLTWETIGDGVHDARAFLDPWMWVDPATDRVFNAPNGLACAWLTWTDDGGRTWEGNPRGGCGLPGQDHQKLTTGPPAPGVRTQGYPSVVYYAYNPLHPDARPALLRGQPWEGTAVSVSLDGGRSFGLPVRAHEPDDCYGGINGAIAVGPEGTAYLPVPTCGGLDVVVSRDSGATWEPPVPLAGGILPAATTDPAVAVDAAGNAYALWSGGDGGLLLARTLDGGATWSAPLRASPPGVRAAILPVLLAGPPGRLAFAYLGTDSDPAGWPSRNVMDAPPEAPWHLHLGFVEDATASDPVFRTQQVSPEDDPLLRGCIFTGGGVVTRCGFLGDFWGIAHAQGRVVVSYMDGCDACAEAPEGRSAAAVMVLVVDQGPSLLGGELAPLAERR